MREERRRRGDSAMMTYVPIAYMLIIINSKNGLNK